MRGLLFGVLVIALAAAPAYALQPSSTSSALAPTTWTVMVYMAADSEPQLPWQDDLNEMEEAVPGTTVNTIALVDPPGPGNSRYLRIVHDPNSSDAIVSSDIDDHGAVIPGSEVNTADPLTLANFVGFTAASFPADRYVLVLWGHGVGWRGLLADGFQLMGLPGLRGALAGATSSIGRPLDMVVIDACAEATLEMMYEIRDYSRYLVASELPVPFEGLPYGRVLEGLTEDPETSVSDFGSHIADEFIAWSTVSSPYSTAMSVIDLAALGSWSAALNNLADLGTRFDSLFHDDLRTAFEGAEAYESAFYPDVGHLSQLLMRSELPVELTYAAFQALQGYDDVVVDFRSFSHPDPFDDVFAENSSGATVYAPSTAPEDAGYFDLRISTTSWDEWSLLVRRDGASNASVAGPSLSFEDGADDDSLPDVAHLEWPDEHADLSAWVFRQEPGGLVLVSEIEGGLTEIDISSVPGRLVISASAADGGAAVTYDVVETTLFGVLDISIGLVLDADDVPERYEVSITGANGSIALELSGDAFTGSVSVPGVFEVGEVVTVVVKDGGSGETVSIRPTSIPPSGLSRSLVVTGADESDESVWVLLAMALLPGLLVLAFDLMLYLDHKKRAR
ncbi:MAG: hypothetical protein A3K67_05775 [Euryarchaeota archaeon RBG_16_62_10]|nr:MAG: hypothetical protein A3K67_05775 [Euryarchaeota archaeon RBG_16_62_10]